LYESGTTNYDGFMVRHPKVTHEGKESRRTGWVDVATRVLGLRCSAADRKARPWCGWLRLLTKDGRMARRNRSTEELEYQSHSLKRVEGVL